MFFHTGLWLLDCNIGEETSFAAGLENLAGLQVSASNGGTVDEDLGLQQDTQAQTPHLDGFSSVNLFRRNLDAVLLQEFDVHEYPGNACSRANRAFQFFERFVDVPLHDVSLHQSLDLGLKFFKTTTPELGRVQKKKALSVTSRPFSFGLRDLI